MASGGQAGTSQRGNETEQKSFILKSHDEDTEKRRKPIVEVEQNIEMINEAQSDSMSQCGYRKEEQDEVFDCPNMGKRQYGEIEFVGCIGKNAKFARLSSSAITCDFLLSLLHKNWMIELPKLLISVIGGEENFNMTPQLLDKLLFDLVNAAQNIDAWIMTGGTNIGVAKHVGEALKYSRINSKNKKNIVAIGMVPWGVIHNRHLLEAKKENEPIQYRVHAEEKANEHERFLNPNHSHFILNTEREDQFRIETNKRALLECELNNLFDEATNDFARFPVVLLVIDGGPYILKRVRIALSNNIPVVVVKGSGHVADLLAYAVTHAEYIDKDDNGKAIEKTKKLNHEQKIYIHNQMKFTKFCETNDIDNNIKEIERCLDNFQLINVFDVRRCDQDLHTTMCNAVLKAKKNDMVAQLRVALTLNSIDFARSAILTADKEWEPGSFDHIMEHAMVSNKVDFVELLLDNTVNIKTFLTTDRLMNLYNNVIVSGKGTAWKLLLRQRGMTCGQIITKLSLKNVEEWTTFLLGDYYLQYNLECGKEETFENPFLHLLIWAVLSNLQDMAKLFWRKGMDSIAAALLAHALLSAMANRIRNENSDLFENIEANSREFLDLAVEVLKRCYRTSKYYASALLIGDLVPWDKSSCFLIAMKTNNEEFISTQECQETFNDVWMGHMTQNNSILKLLMCLFIPPLIPLWVHVKLTPRGFDNVQKHLLEDLAGETAIGLQPRHKMKLGDELIQNFRTAKERIISFYRAPVVSFLSHVISYMTFLGWYSYVIINKFDQTVSVVDAILIAWVVSIIIGEIRQVITTRYIYSGIKLKAYLADFWNIADILMILLFVVGMILKHLPYQKSFEAARVVLSVNLVICFLRLLQMFSLNKELGPKLVMIIRMIHNLTSFFVIFLIFIVACAIASQAILYPNTEISYNLLWDIFWRPYWNIYGELMLDEIEGKSNCTNIVELYRNGTQPRCPTEYGKYVVTLLMGVYTLMCNILLLNLLISIFSNTYQKVQENADKHWRIQRFYQIQGFLPRSIPVPFCSFLTDVFHIILFLKEYMCQCKTEKRTLGKNVFLERVDTNSKLTIRNWERSIAQDFINSKKVDQESVENSAKAITQRLDKIDSRMQEQHHTVSPTIEDDRLYHSQTEYLAQPKSSPGSVTSDQMMDNTGKKLKRIVDTRKKYTSGAEQASPEKTDGRVEGDMKADLERIEHSVQALNLRLDQLFRKMDGLEEQQHATLATIENFRLHTSQAYYVATSESSMVDESSSVTLDQRIDVKEEQIPWIDEHQTGVE